MEQTPTVIDFTLVSELVCLTERVHEIRQTRRIEVRRVVYQQRFDELPEPEIQKE